MAFTNNKTMLKKKNYNAFLFTDNKSLAIVSSYSETILNALRDFPSNPREAPLGTTAMSSSYEVYVIQSGSFTAPPNDGKLRFGLNLANKSITAYIGNTVENLLLGVFPLGTCLSEAEIKEEKGEEVKLLSGDTLVVDKNVSFNILMPRNDGDLRKFIIESKFPLVGIMFKELFTKGFAYINQVPMFSGATIKANALSQLAFSANYQVPTSTAVMLLGDE